MTKLPRLRRPRRQQSEPDLGELLGFLPQGVGKRPCRLSRKGGRHDATQTRVWLACVCDI